MQPHIYKIIFLLFTLTTPVIMFAQTQKNDTIRKDTTTTIPEKKIIKYTLKGIVTGETDDETLPGAHIYVGEDKKPTTVTNAMGEFTLKDLLPGELVITASFVGYQATTQKYLVKVDTNVGRIKLLPEVLEEVVITAKPPLIIQKGETTEFNANALKVPEDAELEDLLNILSSSIGSLTNPEKLKNTFKTVKKSRITSATIKKYLDYFEDSFLIESAQRYDIKGKAYIETPKKYYFSDLGLRNARINFRQFEQTHSMENIIYNELRMHGYSVDVGVIPIAERDQEGNSSDSSD